MIKGQEKGVEADKNSLQNKEVDENVTGAATEEENLSKEREEILAERKLVLLTDSQKRKLTTHVDVRQSMKSRRLRAQLERINNATDRQGELKRARLIPEFEAFISTMLKAIEVPESESNLNAKYNVNDVSVNHSITVSNPIAENHE